MTWGAVASVAGSVISAAASSSASDTQSSAANKAADNQMQMFQTINDQQKPYRESGVSALSALNKFMGLPTIKKTFNQDAYNQALDQYNKSLSLYNSGGGATNVATTGNNMDRFNNTVPSNNGGGSGPIAPNRDSFYTESTIDGDPNAPGMHSFNASDLATNLSPSYQFMLDQGLGQAKNAANASGGLLGGNALQGLNNYAQNYASTGYQQAYNNYTANQSNIYNRLSNIAGLGQTANQATANAGLQSVANANGYSTDAAAAQAAGTKGAATSLTNGFNGLAGWNYLNGSSGSNDPYKYTSDQMDSNNAALWME